MKRETVTTLSITAMAALSVAMLMPAASAQENLQPQSGVMQSQSNQGETAGQAETLEMVSARVAVTSGLDAAKAKAGDQISTRLAKKITLKDGKQLPAGTKILGVIAEDDMQANGKSELALTFNQAQLKDGTTIAIKATIVGVYAPETQDINGNAVKPGDQFIGDWAAKSTEIDQEGALPGVDLHSKIDSTVSGVLVSRHDVKLKWGSEISLAVALQPTQGGSSAQGK